jgi:hypothetical protein
MTTPGPPRRRPVNLHTGRIAIGYAAIVRKPRLAGTREASPGQGAGL